MFCWCTVRLALASRRFVLHKVSILEACKRYFQVSTCPVSCLHVGYVHFTWPCQDSMTVAFSLSEPCRGVWVHHACRARGNRKGVSATRTAVPALPIILFEGAATACSTMDVWDAGVTFCML